MTALIKMGNAYAVPREVCLAGDYDCFFSPYSADPDNNRQGLMASEVALSSGDSLQSGAEHISYNPLAVVGYF